MEYIWLSEPLHKNRINYDIESELIDSKRIMMSFDGSVVAFDETLIDDKQDLKKEIDKFNMGYNKDFKLPIEINNLDDLLIILMYLSE